MRVIAGERLARRAGLMLAASVAFLLGGQYVNHDMMVATWVAGVGGLWALLAAWPRR